MLEYELLFELQGLGCANCASKIERKVNSLPEISKSEVNFMNQSLRVQLTDKSLEASIFGKIEVIVHSFEPDVIVRKLNRAACPANKGAESKCDDDASCGCAVSLPEDSILTDSERKEKEIRRLKFQILLGAVIFAAAFILDLSGGASTVILLPLYLIAYTILGFPVLWRALSNIVKGKIFDENFLMAIATIGAIAISEWSEAVAVMLFYQVGELFQTIALHRSRRSISELMSIRPDYANIQKDGKLIQVHPDTVQIGGHVIVKPGEKVPLDGIVVSGRSMLDTAALTGESVFRDVEAGDIILSGCVNKDGVLTIEVTASFGESTVSRIIEMVTNAGSRKSKSENLITRFAAVYTPIVVVAAVLLAAVPPLFFGGDASLWVYRALSFLVVSCPCALVISVPLGYFGGIGAASKRGILVKGSNFLDALARADSIVFDKTGTLTRGTFAVTKIVPAEGVSEEDLLRLASTAEAYSDHPIALSVRKAAQERAIHSSLPDSSAYREMAGRGVAVQTKEKDILVGNRKLMLESGIEKIPDVATVGTLLYAASDGRFAGYLEIADQIKPEALKVIQKLRDLHINEIALLTGDHAPAADAAARELGITDVFSELLPAQKLDKMEELIAARKNSTSKDRTLIYVGDGINDAPVLARADIGIAIGAMASGAAIEAADIVIMTDDLDALPKAIRIAGKTRRIVTENIIFALSVKALILVLSAFGLTNLWFAIFADVGVAVIAIVNAVRTGS